MVTADSSVTQFTSKKKKNMVQGKVNAFFDFKRMGYLLFQLSVIHYIHFSVPRASLHSESSFYHQTCVLAI
jgi:hypothetical protein